MTIVIAAICGGKNARIPLRNVNVVVVVVVMHLAISHS
jgi:hypothetical protein